MGSVKGQKCNALSQIAIFHWREGGYEPWNQTQNIFAMYVQSLFIYKTGLQMQVENCVRNLFMQENYEYGL